MSMTDWARKEIEIACKRENPDWDGESFDYGCGCYQSALKAYESLMEDGHSGFSFSITKSILIRLLDGHPLTQITDEDFVEDGICLESPEYLADRGLKSDIQCSRMSSLFRKEYLDGRVEYTDIDRAYAINVDYPDWTFTGSITKIIDEMFPIVMPYYPQHGKYKVYVKEFLCDKSLGDFDHQGVLKIVTPDGEEIEVDDYFFREEKGKGMVKISKEQFYEDLKHKINE